MSQAGEPDGLAGGGEPAGPAEPAGQRQRGQRADAVQPVRERAGGGHGPGLGADPVPQVVHPAFQAGQHVQGDSDLQLPGPGQVRRCQRGQGGLVFPGPHPGLCRGALVEQHRVDPLDPRRVLGLQVMIGLHQRPAFQDMSRRDPALRYPPGLQQDPHMPRITPVGLGVPLAAPRRRGIGRLGQVHPDPGPGQLLGHVPPAGAPFDRERHVIAAANRASHSRSPARSAGRTWPRDTSPDPVSR